MQGCNVPSGWVYDGERTLTPQVLRDKCAGMPSLAEDDWMDGNEMFGYGMDTSQVFEGGQADWEDIVRRRELQ